MTIWPITTSPGMPPILLLLTIKINYWFTKKLATQIGKFIPRKSEDFLVNTLGHWLINYIDTKAKCRHLKNWHVKGLRGRCLSEFINWRYSRPWLYFHIFDPALWPVVPLMESLIQLSPFPVWISILWGAHVNWEPDAQSIKVFFFHTT